MHSVTSTHTLICRTRRGELNFERLVEHLASVGFITESDRIEGCGFGSTAMESARQEDFDALFKLFFPGHSHSIELSCAATDAGGIKGCFSYALFNSNVIEHEEVKHILRKENRENNS